VLLEPLGAAETEELIETLLAGEQVDEGLRTRILEAAGGNPLFVEEMLAMLKERRPGGDVAVPPTIQALLAARLDQLEVGERGVLERGAVEGQVFHRGAVLALGPEELQVSSRLMTLVRKDLVRPEQATMPGDEAFRFRHLLIRDAAYEALPKATRAELHERFAEWLEEHGVALVEFDEILGYHLEQAYRYREELGPLDAHGRELGARAGRRFAAAGARALARGDTPGAVNLLDRAASLLAGSGSEGIAVLVRLGYTLTQAGEFARADEALRKALESAQESGDRLLELRARVEGLHLRLYVDPEGRSDEARAAAEQIIPELEALADDEGLARAWQLVSITELTACRYGPTAEALERALLHARRAGDRALEADIRFWLGCAIGLGPMPAPAAGARCRELFADSDSPLAQISLHMSLGVVAAQTGDLDEARRLVELARAQLEDLGMPHFEASTSMWVALVELRAGNPAAAEAAARPANQLLESLGEQSFRSTVVAFLAEAVYRQGRYDEALDLTRVAEEAAASDDIYSQALLRGTRAKVLAQSQDFEQAEAVAREAVALAERGDALDLHADMLLDLGEVMALAGRPGEASEAFETAEAVYERKGNVAGAEQARSRLGQVRTP
jgi:tetratricopeptide (TPR) repeat protein